MGDVMRFSFIIPVYNAERYVEKCLNSIIQQNYDSYEILLIDDGSRDSGGEICRSVSAKNNNIIYEYQENAGPSAARNKGIEKARGEYLIFLDSDDEIKTGTLSRLDCIIREEKPDAIISNLIIRDLEHGTDAMESVILDKKSISCSRRSALQELTRKRFYTPASRVVVRREIVVNNNIRFPLECFIGEDVFMMALALCKCETFCYNQEPYYIYNQNPTSIMHNVNFQKMTGTLESCKRLFEISHELSEDRKQFLYSQISRMAMIVFTQYVTEFSPEQRKIIRSWMDQNGALLKAVACVHPATRIAGRIIGVKYAFLLAGTTVLMIRKR